MEPKYKIGDEVWFILNSSISSGNVSGIQRTGGGIIPGMADWEYSVSTPYSGQSCELPEVKHIYRSEQEYFPTKQALLDELAK